MKEHWLYWNKLGLVTNLWDWLLLSSSCINSHSWTFRSWTICKGNFRSLDHPSMSMLPIHKSFKPFRSMKSSYLATFSKVLSVPFWLTTILTTTEPKKSYGRWLVSTLKYLRTRTMWKDSRLWLFWKTITIPIAESKRFQKIQRMESSNMVWLTENTPQSKDVSQQIKKMHGTLSWKKSSQNKREHTPKMNSMKVIDFCVKALYYIIRWIWLMWLYI